jgi:predicted Zn-dependent protease
MIKKCLICSIFFAANCFAQGSELLNGFGKLLDQTGVTDYVSSDSLIKAGQQVVEAATGFSNEEEYYLGRAVSASILGRYPLLKRKVPAEFVTKVGRALAAHSDRPDVFGGYQFGILDTDEINAMATPGGFIFVTKGLVKLMPDEDSLAAVLAHEIGHVVKGHGMSAISSSNMRGALLVLGQEAVRKQGSADVNALTDVFGEAVSDVTDTLIENGYSRSQEYEADAYAAKLLVKAGYNDAALVSMLEGIKAASNKEQGWFATHPDPDKRISEVKEEITKVKPEVVSAQAVRAKRFKEAMKVLS